jgi:hypothetical protein
MKTFACCRDEKYPRLSAKTNFTKNIRTFAKTKFKFSLALLELSIKKFFNLLGAWYQSSLQLLSRYNFLHLENYAIPIGWDWGVTEYGLSIKYVGVTVGPSYSRALCNGKL